MRALSRYTIRYARASLVARHFGVTLVSKVKSLSGPIRKPPVVVKSFACAVSVRVRLVDIVSPVR